MAVIMDMQPEGYSMDTLEQYQYGTSAENQIYNAETNTLYIEDVNNLTIPEIQCILACRTNNPSLNSFAGEIVFHAEYALATTDYDEVSFGEVVVALTIRFAGIVIGETLVQKEIYDSAISADLAVGSVGEFREEHIDTPLYKEPDAPYIVEQREIWGICK